jgi:iron complex transport system permease protein
MSVRSRHDGRLLLALAIAIIALFVVSLGVGPATIAMLEAVRDLWSSDPGTAAIILREVRLPRALLAMLAGGTLGLAGAVLQGLLRNPLADPGVLGVSATAGLGSVVVLYFGMAAAASWILPLGGMVGAMASVVFVLALAGRDTSTTTLVLAGVAINAIAGAFTALALNLAPSPYAALEIVFWLLGSLADRSFDHVALAAPPLVAGVLLLAGTGRALDTLALGEEAARSLGVALDRLRWQTVLGVALSVGAVVSVSGGIGFVGLVVPHLLRPLVGHEPRRLLWPSALAGGALLLAADLVARVLPTNAPLQIGVVTAMVGAPFFLYLVVTLRRAQT